MRNWGVRSKGVGAHRRPDTHHTRKGNSRPARGDLYRSGSAGDSVSAGVFLLLRNGAVESPSGVARPPSGATTVVSLTFDDGYASQINAQRLLAQHHMNGTFYSQADSSDSTDA